MTCNFSRLYSSVRMNLLKLFCPKKRYGLVKMIGALSPMVSDHFWIFWKNDGHFSGIKYPKSLCSSRIKTLPTNSIFELERMSHLSFIKVRFQKLFELFHPTKWFENHKKEDLYAAVIKNLKKCPNCP